MINNSKGDVIDNNMHVFSSKCCSRLSQIMFGLKDLVNFASASGDGIIVIFAHQISTHVCAILCYTVCTICMYVHVFVCIFYLCICTVIITCVQEGRN